MFGLISKKQHQEALTAIEQLRNEVESYKVEFNKIPHWLLSEGEAQHYNMPDPSIYENQSDLYRKISWIVAACENIANVAAGVKFDVFKRVGEKLKDIPNHPFEILLDKPNPLDSRSEFLKATIISWKLTGNAYWWLNKTDKYSEPIEIWPIPSHMIIPNPDGNLFLKNYLYYPGTGEELAFETWEIVHFRRYNPFSRFIGLSAIESIALTAFGDIGMASWNAKLFRDNNGRLPGMITFEQFIPDDTWNIIKSDMDEAARKRAFLMLRGVGSGAVNWFQNAVSQREMEFLEGRKANRDEIWSVLAPGLVSYLSENATEANSRTGESAFEKLSVQPTLNDMGEKITNDILEVYGRNLIGKFEDMRTANEALELEKQREYAKTHSINQINSRYWGGDQTFSDERGDLLPQEITAAKTAEEPIKRKGEKPDEQTPEEKVDKISGKAILDLERFQRKALKTIGKDCEFLSEYIPESTLNYIHGQLTMCFTEPAIKAVFAQARKEIDFIAENESKKIHYAVELAESINKLAKGLFNV